MTSPSDLVALVARLRAFTASYSEMQACADAIEQLQAELLEYQQCLDAGIEHRMRRKAETEAESLRAELARLRSLEEVAEADSLSRAIAASEANCDALRAELEAMRKPAEVGTAVLNNSPRCPTCGEPHFSIPRLGFFHVCKDAARAQGQGEG